MKKLLFVSVLVMSFVSAISAQNKFEGYNIILNVPETHTAATCALRYVPPSTKITISDLNGATPMNLKSCDGSESIVSKASATSYIVNASASDYKWCFQGEDKRYRLTFQGDNYTGPVTYNWIANPEPNTAGRYSVREFGAVGDGKTDDTIAVQSALAFLASRNGGVLFFPEGDYQIGLTPNFKGLTIPSGVTIEGIGGLQTNAPTSHLPRPNPSRITLNGTNRALFRIGECTEKVTIRAIELYSRSPQGTSAVEALGAYNTSQDMYFEDVAFNNFNRGLNAYGLPQTNLGWQFDYIQVVRCRFIFITDAGIYTNVRNTNWRIQDVFFINPPRTSTQKADSMFFERAGAIMIENTVGGGFASGRGGTFLNILDSGTVLISHTLSEQMTNTFVYNEERNPQAGDHSYPITILNSVLGDPIIFNARRTLVSTGNLYGPDTFKADERVRVYSTGDRFCYDGGILGCRGAEKKNFDKATLIFMTGQPDDGTVKGHPTVFGTDVLFGNPISLPNLQQSQLPAGKPNGTMVYCVNCRRGGTPCQSGGNGAPAMVVNGQWSCL